MYQVYVCETCGHKSIDRDEVELCETKHMGLKSLEDKHTYDALKGLVKHCSAVLSSCSNDQTRAAFDNAIKQLIAFEEKHGIASSI